MAKHGGGRPLKYSPEEVQELLKKFEEYIEETNIPIIAEFAYKNNILRESMYDYLEFATLIKKCVAKKEAQLEKGCLAGKLNASMAIFSLKQMGWSDRVHHNMDDITIKVELASEAKNENDNK